MHWNLLSTWIDLYSKIYSDSLKIYSDVLQKNTQTLSEIILSPNSNKGILTWESNLKESWHSQSSTNQVVIYYDFWQHQRISELKWYDSNCINSIEWIEYACQDIVLETEKLSQSIYRKYNLFFRYVELYITHVAHPVFQFNHYQQFLHKRIWVQKIHDNVIYAFSYPLEEMILYKELDEMQAWWEEERQSLLRGFLWIIQSMDNLWLAFAKISLSHSWDEAWFMMLNKKRLNSRAEILEFMNMLKIFEPGNYLYLDKDSLKEIQTKIGNNR